MDKIEKRWAQSFTSGYKRERFLRRINASNAAEWLSFREKSENASRVLALIAGIQGALAQGKKEKRQYATLAGRKVPRMTRTEKQLAELQRCAAKLGFRIEPDFSINGNALECKLQVVLQHGETCSPADAQLAIDIQAAAATGDLNRLHRCEWPKCGQFFFKRVDAQRFCSSRCREKAFKSTPEFKEKRAENMRYKRAHPNIPAWRLDERRGRNAR